MASLSRARATAVCVARTQRSATFSTGVPAAPAALVTVCVDGCDPRYLRAAARAGCAPFLARLMAGRGTYVETFGAMPSFTNPNNAGILTGGPPSWHGVSGNYGYDAVSGKEVATGGALAQASLLATAHTARACPVVVVTAKDKLLRLLSTGLPPSSPSALCVSMESAASAPASPSATLLGGTTDFPRPWPTIYDPDCSAGVLRAGTALISSLLSSPSSPQPGSPPVLAFLSTTDFVQHKAGPEEELALDQMSKFDDALADMHARGWAITLTGDHGMNAKAASDGSPRVVWLGSALEGAGIPGRVALPITDAHVTHHGALGGYACVHLGSHAARGVPAPPPDTPLAYHARAQVDDLLPKARAALRSLPGVQDVFTRADAIARFQLPDHLVGDLVVVSTRGAVLGKTPAQHDVSGVSGKGGAPPLRSHGSTHDARVPFLTSWEYGGRGREGMVVPPHLLRNWHALAAPLLHFGVLPPHALPPFCRYETNSAHPDGWTQDMEVEASAGEGLEGCTR